MPMPRWWGQVNKRVFNPRAMESGRWQTLTHVGRSSGRTYRTPLEAHEIDGKYLFVLVYGSGADWVQNTLAEGTAVLQAGDEEVRLSSPRIVSEEIARPMLAGKAKLPPRLLKIDEFLIMDIVSRERGAATQRY
jgi:deazaflavin-dependent oxidoreductase (nitroreductase family)